MKLSLLRKVRILLTHTLSLQGVEVLLRTKLVLPDGSGSNQDTATFTVPTSYSATPYTFTVEVQEGSSGGTVATDTITISSIKPGSGRSRRKTGNHSNILQMRPTPLPLQMMEQFLVT